MDAVEWLEWVSATTLYYCKHLPLFHFLHFYYLPLTYFTAVSVDILPLVIIFFSSTFYLFSILKLPFSLFISFLSMFLFYYPCRFPSLLTMFFFSFFFYLFAFFHPFISFHIHFYFSTPYHLFRFISLPMLCPLFFFYLEICLQTIFDIIFLLHFWYSMFSLYLPSFFCNFSLDYFYPFSFAFMIFLSSFA